MSAIDYNLDVVRDAFVKLEARATAAEALAKIPGAPSLTVTSGNGQNSLSWVDGPTGGSATTAHKLYSGSVSGTMTLIGTITSASPYLDTGLTNGSARFYRISAVNSSGEGALSTEMAATPRAPLTISGTPASATQNSSYSFTPTVAGGFGTRTFALTGTLPAGLNFSTTTGAVTGTPTTAGTTSGLNITVTDSTGSASLGTFSIVVTAQAASPFFGSSTSTWDNTSPTFGATA